MRTGFGVRPPAPSQPGQVSGFHAAAAAAAAAGGVSGTGGLAGETEAVGEWAYRSAEQLSPGDAQVFAAAAFTDYIPLDPPPRDLT